jgi:hypothetical protein
MKPLISLSRALTDPALFGSTFRAPSFWTWRTLAKVIDGIPFTEQREIELFRQCTGRSELSSVPGRRIILLAGRRAGKDRFLSACAVWRAALCADWRKHTSAGEQAVCLLLGADKRQAVILRKYCETGEVIEFKNGASPWKLRLTMRVWSEAGPLSPFWDRSVATGVQMSMRQALTKRLWADEEDARRLRVYEDTKTERDQLADELREFYPDVAERLADLLAKIAANDDAIERINANGLPREHGRLLSAELTARGLDGWVLNSQPLAQRLTAGCRLPAFRQRPGESGILWPRWR